MRACTIRVSDVRTGYCDLPGLAQVSEVRSRVTILKTGEVREEVRYLVTSIPLEAGTTRVPTLNCMHWHIENRCFHVKGDSFVEDRHVLGHSQRWLTVSLLRTSCAL